MFSSETTIYKVVSPLEKRQMIDEARDVSILLGLGGVNLMQTFKGLTLISLILVIIGAINWGLVGVLGFDLVATLFGGADSLLSRIVYTLVGLAGLQLLTLFAKK
jgi:uncharacterized membrane protein YuzA (DUF378 family)